MHSSVSLAFPCPLLKSVTSVHNSREILKWRNPINQTHSESNLYLLSANCSNHTRVNWTRFWAELFTCLTEIKTHNSVHQIIVFIMECAEIHKTCVQSKYHTMYFFEKVLNHSIIFHVKIAIQHVCSSWGIHRSIEALQLKLVSDVSARVQDSTWKRIIMHQSLESCIKQVPKYDSCYLECNML